MQPDASGVLTRPTTQELAGAEIPFFGVRRAHHDLIEPLERACREVLLSGNSLQGAEVRQLEQRLARMVGRRHAVAVGSATDGLFFALSAVGIGPGDDVLVPALSFVASASCILRIGANPVFVDVDADGNIDLGDAGSRLTKATRAIIAVHLYGRMMVPDELETFAVDRGLGLIEDAAQGFGAELDGRAAGNVGDVSVLSFDPTKVVGAVGSGGMVLTDDDETAEALRRARYHGKSEGTFTRLGYNSQLPSLVAAMLSVKLDRHRRWTQKRQAIADRFDQSFAHLPIETGSHSPRQAHAYQKFALRCDEPEKLGAHLARLGIPTRRHYAKTLPEEPVFAAYGTGDYPKATAIARRTVSLPIHAYLTDSEVERIARGVTAYFT